VFDPGHRPVECVDEQPDFRRPFGVRVDPGDHEVQVRARGVAVQRPQRLVAGEPEPAH